MNTLRAWLQHYRGECCLRYGEVLPLMLTTVLVVVGNLIYTVAADKWTILAARFILGISAASSTASKSFVSKTPKGERKQLTANYMTAQTLGFIGGPALGAMISVIVDGHASAADLDGQESLNGSALQSLDTRGISENTYRYPGVLAMVFGTVALVSLFWGFEITPHMACKMFSELTRDLSAVVHTRSQSRSGPFAHSNSSCV